MLWSRPSDARLRCRRSLACNKMEYRGLIPTPPATSSSSTVGSEGAGSKKKSPPTRMATWEPTVHWEDGQRKERTMKIQQMLAMKDRVEFGDFSRFFSVLKMHLLVHNSINNTESPQKESEKHFNLH